MTDLVQVVPRQERSVPVCELRGELDASNVDDAQSLLLESVGNDAPMVVNAPLGRAFEVEIPVSNPGANVIQVEVPPGTRELTLDNNRALFVA